MSNIDKFGRQVSVQILLAELKSNYEFVIANQDMIELRYKSLIQTYPIIEAILNGATCILYGCDIGPVVYCILTIRSNPVSGTFKVGIEQIECKKSSDHSLRV